MIDYQKIVEDTLGEFDKRSSIALTYRFNRGKVKEGDEIVDKHVLVITYKGVTLYVQQGIGDPNLTFKELLNQLVAFGITNHYLLATPKPETA